MYYLSECLIIKNENQYLLEHINSDDQAGIEHFFIYDNLSDYPVKDFLNENAKHLLSKCTIEIFADESTLRQQNCYAKFLKLHGKETKFAAFTDTDEIFEGDLQSLCKEYESEAAGFYFCGIVHGANGHTFKNNKTLKENFYNDVISTWFYRKSVMQTEFIKIQDIHTTTLNTDKKIIIVKNDLKEKVKLHHYYYRSFEEWVQKIKRGSMHKSEFYKVWVFFKDNHINELEMQQVLTKYNIKLYE